MKTTETPVFMFFVTEIIWLTFDVILMIHNWLSRKTRLILCNFNWYRLYTFLTGYFWYILSGLPVKKVWRRCQIKFLYMEIKRQLQLGSQPFLKAVVVNVVVWYETRVLTELYGWLFVCDALLIVYPLYTACNIRPS